MSTKEQEQTDTLASRSEADIRRKLNDAPAYAVDQLCALLQYAKKSNIGIKTLSQLLGISSSRLSQMYNGSYNGNYVTGARRIEAFLMEEQNRKLFAGRDEFIETTVAKHIWAILEQTRYNRRIQILQSAEQLGKTRAATEYTRMKNHGRTIKVTVKPGCGSNPAGVFLRELALACGLSDVVHTRIMDLRYRIREALSICDLLIIDEFHQIEHWPEKSVRDLLDYIRSELHADGARGVVLIATNSDVLTLLQAFGRKAKYNLGQMLGRMCNEVLEIYPDDIPLTDITVILERYHPSVAKTTVKKMYDLATRAKLGHYGLLLDIMNRAWTDCKLAGKKMTDAMIMAKAEETMDDIKKRPELRK